MFDFYLRTWEDYGLNLFLLSLPSILYNTQNSELAYPCSTVPEFIDPVFTKTNPKRSFSLNRKRAFWLVFAKTGSIISGTVLEVGRGVL